MSEPTPCETCDHVHPATRDKPEWKWQCMKFPRLEGLSPIAPSRRVVLQPYQACNGINGGLCPLWSRRRDGQKDMGI